jgi:signal transduction histidine kinase/CheY-like chemotaxis protein
MTIVAPVNRGAASATGPRTLAGAFLVAVAVGLMAYASLLVPQDYGRAAPIWIANALTVVCVLRSTRGRWPIWMLAGFVGNFMADLAIGNTVLTSVVLAGANAIEVMICGLGLRRMIPEGFDPGRLRHLALGVGFSVAGAIASAVLASAWLGMLSGPDALNQVAIWTLADTLGLIVPIPCLMILADWRRYQAQTPVSARSVAILVAVVAFEAAIFAQTTFPLLFLVPLAAVIAALVLEMIGAAVIVLATAVLAIGFTFVGRGPIILETSSWSQSLVLLQLFVAVCCGLTLQVAALQEQRRAAVRKLAEAVRDAETAAKVKAEFLANMSHEIRTPLTSILGFASLLADKKLDDEGRRYADLILGASRNLLALVNDVLDFSKLEARRLELKSAPGSPEECVRDVVDLFRPLAAAKQVEMSYVSEALPPLVMTDFDRVRQVLMNLVSNAVKFTERGGVTVRAGYDVDRRLLRFEVQDTGPGLDAAAQAKLFQRFSQVDASLARAHGGSGLGLAISKGLVEALGGDIGVESTPGAGARFWFDTPAPVAAETPEDEGPQLELAAFVGLSLLVVDDNEANRELIRSLLTPLGVNLVAVDGGEAAITLADSRPFDLILMDLRMPGVDGWTAARAIRAGRGVNRDTPMLAFSADITADDQDLALFEGRVRKPIEMAALLEAIARWARQRAAP